MMPEKFWLFAQKGIKLENLPSIEHVLFHHNKRVAYKMDIVGESAWNGDDQDPSQMRGSL